MDVILRVLAIVAAIVVTLLIILLHKFKDKSAPEHELPPAVKPPLPSAVPPIHPAAAQPEKVVYNGESIYQYSQTVNCRKCSSCGCENQLSQVFCEACGCRL
ncbi:MAG: hypothetical protein MJ085_02060 [Clostridia bacterium]|nr:hypothetical protein [Clostridia bacterium]